jgi:hypothetical protein
MQTLNKKTSKTSSLLYLTIIATIKEMKDPNNNALYLDCDLPLLKE